MKHLVSLCLLISLFGLTSCLENNSEMKLDSDVTVNPLRCLDESSVECDMVWKMEFSKVSFPQNVGIYIDDKVIFDECNRNPKISIERRLDTVEVVIWNYTRLTGEEKFKLALYDLGNCYEVKKDFYLKVDQPYTVKDLDGRKYLNIKVN